MPSKDPRAGKDPKMMNGGQGPYGRPAENGMPPEHPLWHGHAWQPTGINPIGGGMFSDGYKAGPGDKPRF